MATKLYSLIDIFNGIFDVEEDPVDLKKIVIPIIQRDYAQGRRNPEVDRVRGRFLDSLYYAVTNQPITLDFIYGDIGKDGVMTPLDGQQRLTTLFLLYWYAAKKENISSDEYLFLKNFSYETRYSARNFCSELIDFTPSFSDRISDEIINQAWFPLEWKKDPTISSMLVMLDAIDERFSDVSDIWGKLRENAITFYFLPIKDMGLTDELYIKMNSRGKPLTQFEHFKAELERNIRTIDETLAEKIIAKIDWEWTDLLWRYRNNGKTADENIIDDKFLRYFKFICDVICFQNGDSPQGKSHDEFDLLQRYFSTESDDALGNIGIMESYFDCWCAIDGYDSPSDFLSSVMSSQHENGKIAIYSRSIDIFGDCLHQYFDGTFPLNRFVFLYAVICYLRSCDKITHDQFARRLRIVNNLIQNSEDEISDRSNRNRIPAVLKQVDSIITTGNIDDNVENSFNTNQLEEEKDKIIFLNRNPDKAEKLFDLEDHSMLKGQISILGLENLELGERFKSLFTCGRDKIDRALMVTGNYWQQEHNKRHFQFASKSYQGAWDKLFHKSSNLGFDNTKKVLVDLLSKYDRFNDNILDEIVNTFIGECEAKRIFPWCYYYVKYSVFRPGSYGILSNNDPEKNPYLYSVMQTRTQWSANTYMPFLKAADESHLSREHCGQRLIYSDRYIECDNSSYAVKSIDDGKVLEIVIICQNSDGIDTEDRILKLCEYIKTPTNSDGRKENELISMSASSK